MTTPAPGDPKAVPAHVREGGRRGLVSGIGSLAYRVVASRAIGPRTDSGLPTSLTIVQPEPAAPRLSRPRRPGELALVFWLVLSAYLAAGAFLVLHQHLLAGDAYSRVAIAHRILFSRDPHLEAIGFVWSPLPILALLPLVPLAPLWPALTTYGFAASIVSAVCMAAAAREVAAFMREIEVRRSYRTLLTLAFAAHPLIVLYAANGMSEAMFLLFLIMAARRLAGWLRTGDVGLGSGAAIALAAAYLSRYEALFAGGAAVGLAAAWAYWRKPGTVRQRLEQAACDAAMLGAPIIATFATLILASWAITGNPMEQFTSSYGNSAQMQLSPTSSAAAGLWRYSALLRNQVLILEPFLLVVAAIAIFRTWRLGCRNAATLAVLPVIGAVLAFMLWSSARGQIDQQLRYMITAVPLLVLTAGSAVGSIWSRASPSPLPAREAAFPGLGDAGKECDERTAPPASVAGSIPAGRRDRERSRIVRGPAAMAAGMATVLMVVAALPVSAYGMTSHQVNPAEWVLVRAAYGRNGEAEGRAMLRFTTERRIATDLDAMHLPPGSVLMDDFLGFAVPLNSRNPRQFVITSDRDFQSVLSDPAGAGVMYVLVPEPARMGLLDAVVRQYPTLYADGGGMATLVREYTNLGDVPPAHWRLYRLRPGSGP